MMKYVSCAVVRDKRGHVKLRWHVLPLGSMKVVDNCGTVIVKKIDLLGLIKRKYVLGEDECIELIEMDQFDSGGFGPGDW